MLNGKPRFSAVECVRFTNPAQPESTASQEIGVNQLFHYFSSGGSRNMNNTSDSSVEYFQGGRHLLQITFIAGH